jgi:uncharacterized membrane protein
MLIGFHNHRYDPQMPSLASWLKLLHVLVAFGFVGGTIARNLALREAARSSEMSSVSTLVGLAGRFESLMVIPGSIGILVSGLLATWAQHRPMFEHGAYWLAASLGIYVGLLTLVPLVFIPRGKVFDAALASAQRGGVVTPQLTAAFRDPAVWVARNLQALAVAFVIALMVLKPF